MTTRWEKANVPEKVGVPLIGLSLAIIWVGAMIESGQDLGLKVIGSGVVLLVASVMFVLGYAVDWGA